MVKFSGVKDKRAPSSGHSTTTGLICFICGASNANWPIYSRSRSSEKMPFFPFLDYHEPPEGARPIDKTSGRVDSCTVCFSFLTQQWHAFEASDTPVVKRIYWLKRSGPETGGDRTQSPQVDKQIKLKEMFSCVNSLDEAEEESSGGLNVTANDDEQTAMAEKIKERTVLTSHVNTSPDSSLDALAENSLVSSCLDRSGLETCYICSRRKPKEFMRSVHTRPQLKTETPFYPCLARHTPPATSKIMDYLGKVLVCEACQKFLFRQWQVFQKNSTPLSERQYQLRSDPTLPREQQSDLSTMVCFICGVTQPATSGRFLYSRKHAEGHPYYPFLNNLKTPVGAMPLTKQGLTRACSGCRKSLHRQWKHFNASGVSEDKREYRIRNEVMVSSGCSASEVAESMKIACYTCGQQCCESDLCPIHTREKTNPLKQGFYFPFIGLLKPPAGCQKLDSAGRTFVCKGCHRLLQDEWEEFEKSGTLQHERSYSLMLVAASKNETDVNSVCFLCGISAQISTLHKLYSYPHSGKGVQDGGPFFPFLSSREPAASAPPIDSEGTISACEICYNNLMVQWNIYETSDILEESNRWLRRYEVACVNCFLCCKQVPRGLCGGVNKQLISFPTYHRPPRTGIVVNNGRDVILCDTCRKNVQKDLEATDDSNLRREMVHQERSKEVGHQTGVKYFVDSKGENQDSKQHFRKDPVIVIDSSEDSEEGEHGLPRLKQKRQKIGISGQSANVSPMHYTTSRSPGVQPILCNKDSLPVSSDSSMSAGQASFAAALRKLAKQAKPTGPPASSPAPSNSSTQSGSPGILASNSKNTGMSPSRTSPTVTQTEGSTKDNGEQASPGGIGMRTPPVPPVTAVEPDHRNHTPGEPTPDPSRGPHRPEVSHSRLGHQVLPGVYSSGPRGHSEVAMLSEHYPLEPPHAPVAFYPYGAKPDIPIYIPRGARPPGPPPLLASKRDGPEAHMLPAFYPSPYPPAVLDPRDAHYNTWRQQRAAEHLRQQHERHAVLPDGTVVIEPYDRPIAHIVEAPRHLPPGSLDPFARRDSPRLRSGDIPDARETRKQETLESAKKEKESESGSGDPKRNSADGHIQRGFYSEPKQGSCPVHGHGPSGGTPTSSSAETPRSLGPHGPPVRGDPSLASKIPRPGEYKQMFVHGQEAPILHPFLVHAPQEGHFPLHPLDERHVEFVRERERQEFLLHERLLFEQKEGIRAQGEEWSRQHLQQEKSGGRGIVHYPQPLHQRQLDSRKSPLSFDHHKVETALGRIAPGHENDFYRTFPKFHHPFHPRSQDGKAFGDRYGNDLGLRHLQGDSANRMKPPERLGVHEPSYLDPYPFSHEGFQTLIPRVDRASSGRDWHRHDRQLFINGDYQPDTQRPKSTDRGSPAMTTRIKEEKIVDESQDKPVIKIKHNPHKLRFLEGLGLVTVGRKKEISQGETGNLKRKYNAEQDSENSVESPSVIDKDDHSSSSSDSGNQTPPMPSQEKLDFMAKLGLLPPSKRQELERSYEIKRTERKNRKVRGRPPKRARRDKENDRDSDNSQGSMDPDNITGPITRQKQQLLQEQERKENRNKDMEKESPIHIKNESGEQRVSPLTPDRSYRRNSEDRYSRQSPTSSSTPNHVPPRLTLQSLTNMEDPFTNISASQFRPPYLRHTGLLSISHEHSSVAPTVRPDPRTVTQPIRPEPLRSMGLTLSEQETREYFSRHSPGLQAEFGRHFVSLPSIEKPSLNRTKPCPPLPVDGSTEPSSKNRDEYKWPGVESVMKAYFTYMSERGLELSVLQDNADMLKSQNHFLNEQAQALSLQMTGLVQAKKDLLEERKILRAGLDKLHFFIESLKR